MQNATIQLSPQAQAILARWETMPARILNAIAAGMDRQNDLTVAHISRGYLSFPKDGPAVPFGLRAQTNRLRGSMRFSKARIQGNTVTSGIGSNVEYAAIHEFGGQTRPHRIEAKDGGALRFFAGGKPVFCKWVNHPGSKMPERAFTRRGIRDRMASYGNSVSRRVIGAMSGSESAE